MNFADILMIILLRDQTVWFDEKIKDLRVIEMCHFSSFPIVHLSSDD